VTPLRPLGAVQFDDNLAAPGQDPRQAVAVPAGAFDGPGPQPAVLAGEADQFLVPAGAGGHGDLGKDATGAGIDRRGAVGHYMCADPDDDLGDTGQTGHCVHLLCPEGT
jgi:hypothetical protein